MNKKGFTIAEIFIALMLIGALTVILFPVIQKSSPDQNKVMFRKTFNTLSQAVSNLINDDTSYPASSTGSTTVAPTITVQKGFNNGECDTTGSYYQGSKFCNLLADQLNTIGPVTCSSSTNDTAAWGDFITADGVVWRIYEGVLSATTAPANDCFPRSYSTNAYQTKIFVDVNGTKGPNCTLDSSGAYINFGYKATCKDPDRFIIGVRFDGNLQVGCSTMPECTTPTDQNAIDILSEPTDNAQE